MFKNFLLFVLTILFLNFSYGSIKVKPNYGKIEIGEKVTISWDLNDKVNNATLSYYSIKNFDNNRKNFNILNSIFEKTSDYTWEIPKELKNDIGYFIIWNDDDKLIERSNNILIVNTSNKINKREVEGEGEGDGEGEGEGVNEEEKPSNDTNDNETTSSSSNSDSGNTEASTESHLNSSTKKTLTVNTSESLTPISSDSQINNISENTRETAVQSKFNEFMENYKDHIYYIVGGGILAVLVVVLIAFKFFSRKNEIPNGKRSIKRFTIHEDMVPPISMYSDAWKNTMSKNKGFNTLSKNNTQKSMGSETEQLINNGDSLISEAEKFAREHGLTDKEWVARKDYIPYREDELEVYEGNRIKVFELYDDLWCYGMNLDHYGTLSNNNEGMFPSSILPISVITKLLNDTGKNTNKSSDTNTPVNGTNGEKNNTQYEVTIDVSDVTNNNTSPNIIVTPENNKDARKSGAQFSIQQPLSVSLVPPKALPVIPNLNRSSSLRSSVHRKRNSNIIEPGKSPLISNSNKKRGSQLSNISNEIEVPTITTTKPKTSIQNKLLFISTNSQKESKHEDAKALLGSPESDSQSKSIDESMTSQNISSDNINVNINSNNTNNTNNYNNNNTNNNSNDSNVDHTNLKQKQPIENSTQNMIVTDDNDNSINKRKDEIYQQQLLIQKQREQLQKQQIEQQKLQEQLKQQQIQQQLQQQEIQKQLQQLQQIQQEKERQILEQKQQLQQQIQQQQIEQQQLRIQREKQQIIQKSKLKEIEYERERLLQASLMKQDDRDNTLPSYSEAVNNNFASSSNSSEMVDGFPLPPQVNNNFMANTSKSFASPVLNSKSDDENPELYPRNTSYKHQIQKRDNAPEVYPRNISKAYVDEHPSIGRKIKQKKPEGSSSQKMSSKEKEASNMNYQ
jgi:hypothetical protein